MTRFIDMNIYTHSLHTHKSTIYISLKLYVYMSMLDNQLRSCKLDDKRLSMIDFHALDSSIGGFRMVTHLRRERRKE